MGSLVLERRQISHCRGRLPPWSVPHDLACRRSPRRAYEVYDEGGPMEPISTTGCRLSSNRRRTNAKLRTAPREEP